MSDVTLSETELGHQYRDHCLRAKPWQFAPEAIVRAFVEHTPFQTTIAGVTLPVSEVDQKYALLMMRYPDPLDGKALCDMLGSLARLRPEILPDLFEDAPDEILVDILEKATPGSFASIPAVALVSKRWGDIGTELASNRRKGIVSGYITLLVELAKLGHVSTGDKSIDAYRDDLKIRYEDGNFYLTVYDGLALDRRAEEMYAYENGLTYAHTPQEGVQSVYQLTRRQLIGLIYWMYTMGALPDHWYAHSSAKLPESVLNMSDRSYLLGVYDNRAKLPTIEEWFRMYVADPSKNGTDLQNAIRDTMMQALNITAEIEEGEKEEEEEVVGEQVVAPPARLFNPFQVQSSLSFAPLTNPFSHPSG